MMLNPSNFETTLRNANDDCKFEKIFVDNDFGDNCPTDPFEVSDADTMMAYLKGSKSAGMSKPVKALEG